MRSCDLTFELKTVLANGALQRTGGSRCSPSGR